MNTIEPKKASVTFWILPSILIIIVLFLSQHCAIAYDDTISEPIIKIVSTLDGDIEKEYFNTPLFVLNLGHRLDSEPFKLHFTKSSIKFLLYGIFISILFVGYIITSMKKYIFGKEYGTSDWAKLKDISYLFSENLLKERVKEVEKNSQLDETEKKEMIEALAIKYDKSDTILTMTEKVCMHNYEMNDNVLIVGGSGAGKSRGYAAPNILQANASFVVTDPKGELLAKLGYFLKIIMGYKLRVLNLDEKDLSDGYNPFVYIHRERKGWEERVLTLIETIILNTNNGEEKSSSDPFWDKAEKLFLQSIFFAVVEAFPKNESNMNTVMTLISWLKIEEDEDNYDSDLDYFFKSFETRYGSDHIAVEQFKEFRSKASGKTAKSIVISAVSRLAPFKVKEVKRIFSYDSFDLGNVGEEKTAIFVILPPVDKTYNFIAGMFFTQLFQELNHCALHVHKHDGQRVPVPCKFILDEFANTCKIPNFLQILAYARSLGVSITIILQSIDQIKAMYKDDWGVIVDNCNALLYLGNITHVDTLKYMSELLGKGTYDKKNYNVSKGRQSSTTTNNDKLGRDLLDPAEIRRLKKSKCLLIVSGKQPFYSNKFNYKKHVNYKYTSDYNKKLSFEYEPILPKKSTNKPKMESPHGEEHQITKITFDELKIEYNQDIISKYLKTNLLKFDFDLDEEVIIDEGELENISIFSKEKSNETAMQKSINLIMSKIINFETTDESLEPIVNDLANSQDNFDFDSDTEHVVHEGETTSNSSILETSNKAKESIVKFDTNTTDLNSFSKENDTVDFDPDEDMTSEEGEVDEYALNELDDLGLIQEDNPLEFNSERINELLDALGGNP